MNWWLGTPKVKWWVMNTTGMIATNIKSVAIGLFHLFMFIVGAAIRLDSIKYPGLIIILQKLVFIYILITIAL